MASLKLSRLIAPGDWPVWHADLNRRARGLRIYGYIDPSSSDVLTRPTPPDRSAIARELNLESDVDPAVLKIHKVLFDEFRILEARYLSDLEAYRRLDSWVNETVDSSWLRIAPETSDLRVTIEFLKTRISLTPDAEALAVREEYREVLKKAKLRGQAQTWYKQWEEVKLRAVHLGIPEVRGNFAIHDFLNATQNWLPDWSNQMRTALWIREEEDNGKSGEEDTGDLEQLGKLFIRTLQHQAVTLGKHIPGRNLAFASIGEDHLPCPCRRDHHFPPNKCNTVHIAVTGTPYVKGHTVRPDLIAACKRELKKPQWKEVIEDIKNGGDEEGDWPDICK